MDAVALHPFADARQAGQGALVELARPSANIQEQVAAFATQSIRCLFIGAAPRHLVR